MNAESFMGASAIEQYIASIEGQCVQIRTQESDLSKEVAVSKSRELLQPAVNSVLERLQKQEHQRSVGVFGGLLSALANDVLPNSSKPIVLDLYTAHGAPALDIDIQANEKHKEEITSGAMKNILSVGLRLIAIARTKQRRFMVLDEPDHWIKPDNVPQFVSVLDKIIKDLGFQILMISHHPKEYFEQTAKCVLLDRQSDGTLGVRGDLDVPSHSGLRAIRLVNFESHSDTIIPLHEGMTILTGENNLGKSSVVRAMKALCNGETHNDRVVKHLPKEEASCRAEILLETGQWVGWRRARKLNQAMRHKNRFYIREDGKDDESTFVAAEDTSDGLPDFIQTALNIKANDKWDIHIAAQEESVFLINKTTKASERAKILALGNEAKILHDMIERNRLQSRQDKEIIRNGEKKLSVLTSSREKFEAIINTFKPGIIALTREFKNIEAKKLDISLLSRTVGSFSQSLGLYNKSRQVADMASSLPLQVKLKDVSDLMQTIKELSWSESWAGVSIGEEEVPVCGKLMDIKEIELMIKKLTAIKVVDINWPKIPNEIDVKNESGLLSMSGRLSTALSAVERSAESLLGLEDEIKSIDLKLTHAWGEHDECPLCHQVLTSSPP
jgi:AAA ATPase domain